MPDLLTNVKHILLGFSGFRSWSAHPDEPVKDTRQMGRWAATRKITYVDSSVAYV